MTTISGYPRGPMCLLLVKVNVVGFLDDNARELFWQMESGESGESSG